MSQCIQVQFDLICLTGCILTCGAVSLMGLATYCYIQLASHVSRCLVKILCKIGPLHFLHCRLTHCPWPVRFSRLRQGSTYFDEADGGILDECLLAIIRLGHGLWWGNQSMSTNANYSPFLQIIYIKLPSHWTGSGRWSVC